MTQEGQNARKKECSYGYPIEEGEICFWIPHSGNLGHIHAKGRFVV